VTSTSAIDALRQAALTPLVSVLLSSRDGARYLEAALESLAAQSYRNLEIVAVDDGSTDGTPAILEKFAARDGRTRLLHAEGIGLAAALHRAAGEARGTLLARQDDDDLSSPERIERQVRFLHLHPEVGVVGTAATRIDEAGSTIGPYPVPLDPASIAASLRSGTPFVHGSVMMSREAYDASGGYRAAFLAAQDVDLWLRMPKEFQLANLPEPLYAWREHPGGVFARLRDQQLFFAATARAFAEERRRGGADSISLLEAAETPEEFLERYPRADRVLLRLGTMLVREGRTEEARETLRRAGKAPRSAAEAAAWRLLSYPVEWSPRGRKARPENNTRPAPPSSRKPR
jgi:glycosyltransferase involved in cell wall biosynthesis